MARRTKGVASVRRLLRRIPDQMRQELGAAMQEAGPVLAQRQKSNAPTLTGATRDAIGWKFYPATLRLVVGIIGKQANRKLFYARILDLGRRGQTVRVRRAVGGSGHMGDAGYFRKAYVTYSLRVKPIAAKRFVTGKMPDLRQELRTRLNGIWDRVLARVSGGGNE